MPRLPACGPRAHQEPGGGGSEPGAVLAGRCREEFFG